MLVWLPDVLSMVGGGTNLQNCFLIKDVRNILGFHQGSRKNIFSSVHAKSGWNKALLIRDYIFSLNIFFLVSQNTNAHYDLIENSSYVRCLHENIEVDAILVGPATIFCCARILSTVFRKSWIENEPNLERNFDVDTHF